MICDDEKKSEKGCQGAPDWVIEILSPSSVKMDCERKVKLYCETDVREYWIVDPEKETVTVYDFAHSDTAQPTDGACALAAESWNKPMLYSFTKQVKAGIFENLWLDFSKLDLN